MSVAQYWRELKHIFWPTHQWNIDRQTPVDKDNKIRRREADARAVFDEV